MLNGAVKAAAQGDASLQKVVSDVVAQASAAAQFTIGTVAGDNIIAASEVAGLTIAGTVAAGAKAVSLQLGSKTVSAQINGATWSYAASAEDLAALGANGVKVLSATATLADGTTASASRPVGLYTTLPTTPTLELVTGDGRINAAEAGAGIVLTGTGQAGTTVTVRWASGTADKSVVVGANGKWSLPYLPSEIPSAATNSVTVSATDQFGNTSAPAQGSVFYDVAIPDAPTIDLVNGNNKVGLSATTTGVVLSGTGERGATVAITWGKYSASSIGVDATTGIWKVTVPPTSLPDNGVQELRVTQTDSVGNTSTPRVVPVTVAATAPPAPTITSFAGDNFVNQSEAGTSVIVRGKASPGQTVFVRFGTFTAKSNTVNALGDWTAVFSGNSASAGIPTDNTHTITAYAVDSDLNQSAIYTYPNQVVVDTRIDSPVVTVVAGDNIVSASELNGGIVINGTADTDAVKVDLVLTNGTNTVTASGRLDGNGGWTASLPTTTVLPDGAGWTAQVTTTDRAGNAATSTSRSFQVDTTAPNEPVIAASGGIVKVVATALTNGVALSGTGEPGAKLVISLKQGTTTLFSNVDAPITVNGRGDWTYTLPASAVPTTSADYTLTAYQIDAAGNLGTASSVTAQIRTIIPPTPTIGSISGDNLINAVEATGAITVSGTVAAGWAGKKVLLTGPYGTATATVLDNNTWTADLPARAAGLTGVTAYAVTARLQDDAGNLSVASSKSATVDLIAPTPAITGTITSDNVLNIAEKAGPVTVSGTVDSDANSVGVTIGGVAGTVSLGAVSGASRSWTATFANLNAATLNADGTANVVLTATDTAGNSKQQTSTVRTDFIAPISPGVDGGTTLRVGSSALNTGIFLSGTGTAGDTVEIVWKLGATEVLRSTGTITIGANGTWNYTFPGSQVPGSNTYTVEVIEKDPAGNASAATSLTAQVNTGALGQPTIGAIATDNFVNLAESTATITVTGTAPAGSVGQTVKVSWGSPNGTAGANATTATVQSNLTWTATLPAAPGGLANGTYSVYALLEDAVGNIGNEVSRSAVVDTQLSVPGIGASITADGVLNITEQANGFEVTGTTDTDVNDLAVTVGGVLAKASFGAASGSSKSWTATYNGLPNPVATTGQALTSGAKTYAVTATATDRAGNVRTATTTVVGDFAAPDAPTIDAGQGSINKAEREGTIRITGKAEAGSTVRAVLDGKAADTDVTADAAGNWAATFSGTNRPADPGVANATLTLTATATDRAGNAGTAFSGTVTLDTAIVTPTITGVFDASNAKVAYINSAMRAAGYTLKGTWGPEAGETLSLTLGGQTFTPVTNADGSWSLAIPANTNLTANAANTPQQIRLTATDAAGNTAAATPVDVNIDFAVAAPTITAINGGGFTAGTTVSYVNRTAAAATAITGTGEVGGTVTVSAVDSRGVATVLGTSAAITGTTWTVNTTKLATLGDGAYTLVATITDSARNTATSTSAPSFTLDQTLPQQPVIDTVAGDNALSLTERGSPVTLTGTAEPNTTVKLVWGSYTNNSVPVNASGRWTVTVGTIDIPGATGGSVPVVVTATDAAGNVAVGTRAVNLDLLSFDPVAGDDVINLAEKGAPVTLSGVYSGAPSSFTVRLHKVADGDNTGNDVVLTPTLSSATSTWSTALTTEVLARLTDGAYTLTATATQGTTTTSSTKAFNVSTAATPPKITTAAHGLLISESDQANGFTVEGTGQAGDTITVRLIDKVTGAQIGSAGTGRVDSATLKFSVRIPSTGLDVLVGGKAYTLQAIATNAVGNTSLTGTQDVTTDFTPPALESFSTTTANGLYDADSSIIISATMTQPVKAGGTITVQLNSGATVTLTAAAEGKTLTGTYIVARGDGTPGTDGLRVSAVTAVNLTTVLDAVPTTLALPPVNFTSTAIRIDGIANTSLATAALQLVPATQTGPAATDAAGKVTTGTTDTLLRFQVPAMKGNYEVGETIRIVLVGGARDGEVIASYQVPPAALVNGVWDTAGNPVLTLSATKALAAGTYTFAVQVQDLAGNLSVVDANTKTLTVAVDNTVPLVDLNGAAAGTGLVTTTAPATATALASPAATVLDAVSSEAAAGGSGISALQVQVAALGKGSLKELLSVAGATNVQVNGASAASWNADGTGLTGTVSFTLDGVSWRATYNAAAQTFTFTAMSGATSAATPLTATTAQAQTLLAALRYTDPNASGSDGLRQFAIRAVDGAGNVSAAVTSTLVVNGGRPAAAAASPIVGIDTDGNGARDNAFQVTLNEAVQVAAATTLANWSGTAALGTGATVAAVNAFTLNGVAYASQFIVTPGTGAAVAAGQTLSLAAAGAIGTGGASDVAAAAVSFTIPKITIPRSYTGAYFAAVNVSNTTTDEIAGLPNFYVNASERVGATPATLGVYIDSLAGNATGQAFINGFQVASLTYTISSGVISARYNGFTASDWGQDGIKQLALRLVDSAGNSGAWENTRKVLLDTVAPGVAQVTVTKDAGRAGIADANDEVRIDFREPVLLDAAGLPAAFGAGATVTAIAPYTALSGGYENVTKPVASSAYASSYIVKLGANPTLAGGQTLTFGEGKAIADMAGNTASAMTVTTATDLFDRPGTPLIGNVTTDNVIDGAENAATQSVAIALSGAKAGDVVTLYRDGVKIGDAVTLTAAQATAASVSIAIAAGAWGADGEHALTATVQRGAGGSEVSSAVRSVYVAAQSAHWSSLYANTIWFDPDTLGQADGTSVTSWTANVGTDSNNARLVASFRTDLSGTAAPSAVLSRDSAGHVQLMFNGTAMVTAGAMTRPTFAGGFANYSQARPLGNTGDVLASFAQLTAGVNNSGQAVRLGVGGSVDNINLSGVGDVARINTTNVLNSPYSMNLWRTVSLLNDGTTLSGAVDDGLTDRLGTAAFSTSTVRNTAATIQIGSSTFQGMVADQILFNTAVTAAVDDEVSTYLAVKYQALGTPVPVTASGATYDLSQNPPQVGVYPILVDHILQLGQTTLGTGNDTVITAGPDFVNTGAGNDLVRTVDLQFRVLDGGIGFDTFVLDNRYSNTVSGSAFNLSDYVSNARGMADSFGATADDARVNANGFHKLQGFEKLDFSQATESQTVKLSLADIDQLAERGADGAYSLYLKLGSNDVLDRSALTGARAQIGVWQDASGEYYNQRLTGTVGSDQVVLYVKGAAPFAPDFAALPDSVTRSATAVTLQFDQAIATAPAASGAGWTTSAGTISGAAVRDGVLTLSGTGLGGTNVLELTYAGTGLLNAAGDAPAWSRIALGNTGSETISLSTRTGAGYAVFGLSGNDRITGTAAGDLIVGGLGNDTMTGGLGADLFRAVENDTGLDTITDFTLAQGDRIDLRALLSHVSLNPVIGADGNLSAISNLKLTAYNGTDLVLWADTGGTGNYNPATAPYGLVLQGLNAGGQFAVGSDATIGGRSLTDLINSQAVLIG